MSERHFIIIVQESSYPQMGALYLTHVLAAHGITTHLLASSRPTDELDDLIERYDPIAVGCSVMTAPEILDFVRHSVHVQRTYNESRTRIPVIWGGMHPTIVWQQTVQESFIDLIVSGEAEVTLPRVLSGIIRTNTLPDEKLVRVETPANLDDLRPEWDATPIDQFVFPESHSVHARVEFKKHNIFYYLLTSRGCTYRCNFCWEVARTAALKAEMAASGSSDDLTWRAHGDAWVEDQLSYLEQRLAASGTTMDGVGLWDDMIFGREKPAHNPAGATTVQHASRPSVRIPARGSGRTS